MGFEFNIFLYLSSYWTPLIDIADPSSMQDACHNELSKYDLARRLSLPVAQWLERPPAVRRDISFQFPSGTQIFSSSLLVA